MRRFMLYDCIMFKPKPRSLRKSLVMAVVNSALISLSLALGIHMAPSQVAYGEIPQTPNAPVEQIDPSTLAKGHNCWGNDGQAHPVPGHVIFHKGDGQWRMGGNKTTGAALDQLPASLGGPGIDSGIVVYQYCV